MQLPLANPNAPNMNIEMYLMYHVISSVIYTATQTMPTNVLSHYADSPLEIPLLLTLLIRLHLVTKLEVGPTFEGHSALAALRDLRRVPLPALER